MPYIYKIENKLNGKIYIGKTLKTIQERWKEHCRDFQKERYEKRPLYSAMNKYGIENFFIEEVEQCEESVLSEREKYWIEYYGSFKYGYNATNGGDCKRYIDRNLIIKTYREIGVMQRVADLLSISVDSVRNILKENNIKIHSYKEINKRLYGKAVMMLSLIEEPQKVFNTLSEAAIFLNEERKQNSEIKGMTGHISQVCNGKRKTAYNHKWKWLN